MEEFKKQFSQAGATQFGSGWAWLLLGSDGKLKVGSGKHHLKPLQWPEQGLQGCDLQQLPGLEVDAPGQGLGAFVLANPPKDAPFWACVPGWSARALLVQGTGSLHLLQPGCGSGSGITRLLQCR